MQDPLVFFSTHVTSVWAALSSLVGCLGAWLLCRPHEDARVEPVPVHTSTEICPTELGQRTVFRDMLMDEIAAMRQVIKEREIDADALRQSLNAALEQSLVLRATVEIMEKRVAFLKDRQVPRDPTMPTECDCGNIARSLP
jgi:hypothetical protein